MNSARAHSTDQVRVADVDGDDGEGRLEDSDTVEGEHRGKDIDDVGPDGSPARLPENRDWLRPSGRPLVHQQSGDADLWPGDVENNRSTGNAHTVTDQVC